MKFKPFQVNITNNVPIVEEAKKGYYLFASRETSISRDEPFITWIINHGKINFIDFPNKNIYDYYLSNAIYFNFAKEFSQEMINKWEEHIGTYFSRKLKLLEQAKKLDERVKRKKTNKEITSEYNKLIELLYDFGEYIWGAWAIIHVIEKEVIEKFPDKTEIIMSLVDPIEYIKMQKDLFILTPKEIVVKYGWLKMYSSYDAEFTEEEFIEIKKEVSEEEIEEQFNKFKINKSKFQELINSISDLELRIKVKAVHAYAFLKTDRIDTWKQVQYYLKSMHQFIADQVKSCSLRNASNLSIQETLDFLETGKFPSLENLELRSSTKALYYWHDEKVEIITDEKLISEVKKVLEGELSDLKELKGFTACKGYAKGKVKIITHSEDLQKIEEGDIFVAKYTFPTYTPYMLKAGAIITNEGGITTHA
ncbi:MAG: PEP-utilizing enzyme, partial [Candidatus Woesearchaeota archaeon]